MRCMDFIFVLITFASIGKNVIGRKSFRLTDVFDNDVQFRLYTIHNPDSYDLLILDSVNSIINSHIDTYKEVKMIIHGWRNHGNSSLNRSIRNAYLSVRDVNIISVDWALLSKKPYPIARLIVDNLGDKIARMVDFLVSIGIPLPSIHLIGHSLGAHVAGVAGQKVLSGRLSRITGLDPAGPLFYSSIEGRLDNTDAEFVDVIHTSGYCLGYFAPLGHVDFYPNKGIPVQPGCGLDVLGRCSHQRSYWFYAESIVNAIPFIAISCSSWDHYKHFDCGSEVLMGEYVDRNARGKFYLKTNSQQPYALGNSSYYAEPLSPLLITDNYLSASERIDNVTKITSAIDEDAPCECKRKKTASVLKQVYKKIAWKKMQNKINDWMTTHDCECVLYPNKNVSTVS